MPLAIFDIDGTLTRTNAVDDECYAIASARLLGIPREAVDWTDAPHITDAGILEWLCTRHLGRASTAEDVAQMKTEFVGLLEQQLARDPGRFLPIPGAPDVFGHLRARGWRLAMATGAWSSSARLKLRAAKIPIDGIPLITSDDAPVRTELLRRAMTDGLDRVVSVGDGLWDVRAAREVGIPFVGVGTGDRADGLRAAGASHVLADLTDFASLARALEQSAVP